jgi:hypothetical protein
MPHKYLPARSLSKISLQDVLTAYRGNSSRKLNLTGTKIGKYIYKELNKARESVNKILGKSLNEVIKEL